MLTVAIGPAHDAELEHAAAVAAEVGAPEEAVLVGRDALTVDSPAFRGAVFYRDAATVQPARLVRALRRAALAAGVRIHERTPVLGIDRSVVRCDRGSVRAEEIVLATNASAAVRWPAARRVAVFRSAIVLTEPVPGLHERIGWRGGEAIADARTYLELLPPHRRRPHADGQCVGRLPARRGRAAAVLPAARRREDRVAVGGGDRRLERPAAGRRHRAGHARALRGGVHRQRRRPELARRPDARPARSGRGRATRRCSPRARRRCRPSRSGAPARTVVRRALLAIDDAETAGRRPAALGRRRPPCARSSSGCASPRVDPAAAQA